MSEPSRDHPGGRLRWYVNRLRCMPPAELPHRLLRALRARAEALGFAPSAVPAPGAAARGVDFISQRPRVGREHYLETAGRIVAGRLDLFALTDLPVGNPPAWNRDPKTGTVAPRSYGKLLDYRNPSLVGDVKYLWELNRHQHLVTLAQAFALSGDPRYSDCLREHLDSWFRDCPCGYGPNWASALEAGLRLVNWSLAWQLIGGDDARLFATADGAGFRDRWLESVFEHARFVRGHLSLHSSANNHLIGEAAGLYFAAVTWPRWPRLARWGARAEHLLEREIRRQNAVDGVNREQAVSYQQFELDLLLLCWVASVACDRPFSRGYLLRMERMLEFIASIMDCAGNVPMIGDADDGYAVRLSREPGFCRYRSLLATGALLFGRSDFLRKAGLPDDKTRWLFRGDVDAAWEDVDPARDTLPVRRAFPDGGYWLLGCGFETPDEIRLLVDAGPIGYRGIAAHGHADALAFTLSVGGRELFVDPGTYAYHADDRWRQYFRGTAAHNTVRVDGVDQSESGGNFMWLRKARARCLRFESTAGKDTFTGSHDGYRRLPDPVVHRRTIELNKRARRIVIVDELDMAGEHDIEIILHLCEDCRVDPLDGAGRYAISLGEQRVTLRLPAVRGAETGVYRGSVAPVFGWISRRYDHREPTATIRWRAALGGANRLRTEIDC